MTSKGKWIIVIKKQEGWSTNRIWPPNSPDLNPIEAMWNILKNRVADRHPQNKADLIKFAKEEWDLIPNDVVQKLLDRATQLRKECAKNGGYKVGR